MADMLVNLYSQRVPDNQSTLESAGINFRRALSLDKALITTFIETQFDQSGLQWACECSAALHRMPVSCYVAVHERRPIGFACYDATAKGLVGPLGVHPAYRKRGIAHILLNLCFEAMTMEGYAYAVIGWVSSVPYYQKTCNAIEIAHSTPGIYARMIKN